MHLIRRLFGHPRLVLGELISLGWVAITSMFDLSGIAWVSQELAKYLPWIGLAIFVILVYAHIYSLQNQLNPKMDLVYGDFDSCIHRWKKQDVLNTIYRVGIRNLSGKTIEDVKISLAKLEPQGNTFVPIPLRFMHQRSEEQRFDLHPGSVPSRFVDVIQKPEKGMYKRKMFLCFAFSDVPNSLSVGRYRLTLLAEGRDVPSCLKSFIVDMNDEWHVSFEEDDDEQEKTR